MQPRDRVPVLPAAEVVLRSVSVASHPPSHPSLSELGQSLAPWFADAPRGGVEAERALDHVRRELFASFPGSDTAGRYRCLSLIGRGGMGVVYRGWDATLGRAVALKFLRLDRGGERRRLIREARAMARVDHENVVAIFDVAEHQGESYIAMELIDGCALGDWLAASPRSVGEVLATMKAAGRGLAAAHAQGVVHRDFKPHNILVADSGRVAVADFGLACSTVDASATAASRAGTPRYMSPEQRRGHAIDARTDQWAFAATMWEALCQTDGNSRPPEPLGRPLPGSVPRGVVEALERALREAPHERFESMAALLTALQARRRRGIATVLPAGAALIVAGALAWTWACDQAGPNASIAGVRPASEASALAPVLDPALHEAQQRTRQRLEQVQAAVLSGAFALAEQASRDAITSAGSVGRLRAEAGTMLGRVQLLLGRHRRARVTLEAAFFEAARAEVPDAALTSAIALIELANHALEHDETDRWTRHAEAWKHRSGNRGLWIDLAGARASTSEARGDYEDALRHLDEAWTLCGSDSRHPRAYRVLTQRGLVEIELGRYEQAAETFRRADRAWRRTHDEQDPTLLTNLGNAAFYGGDYETAGEAYEQAYVLRRQRQGDDHRDTVIALMNMGLAEHERGHSEAGRRLLERAVASMFRIMGEEHPDTALALGNLATVEASLGHRAASLANNRRALAIYEAAWGARHPRVAHQLGNVAEALFESDRVEEAVDHYRQALSIGRELLGDDHPMVSHFERRLATIVPGPVDGGA